ncbi:MAG: protease [Parcubacteria group bacterium RIFCSPLOWO2_01_FULL_48_18]|nr:MAG: protease [Parcubacteria group bacterium RIFCSPHIGHO2_02_FULL_48_10b]OHB23405.1 MAG: protease [Parcubacteria group bacterium RIFCSPLOWO2_01_FULL_48_18]
MAKVAILVEQQYQELEVWYPALRLKEEGWATVFVGPAAGVEYKGKYGYPVKSELAIDDARAEDFDAVVVPGGFAPDFMRRVPRMVEFVRTMHEAGKVVAAICHGGWLLASAEIVRNKKVTSFFAIKDDLVHAGARWIDSEAVVDGTIITSRKPEDLPAFCREIIKQLRA